VLIQAKSSPVLNAEIYHFRALDSNYSNFSYVSATNTRAQTFEAGPIMFCDHKAHKVRCECNGLIHESVYFKNQDRGYQILKVKLEAPAYGRDSYHGLCSPEEHSSFFTSLHSPPQEVL